MNWFRSFLFRAPEGTLVFPVRGTVHAGLGGRDGAPRAQVYARVQEMEKEAAAKERALAELREAQVRRPGGQRAAFAA